MTVSSFTVPLPLITWSAFVRVVRHLHSESLSSVPFNTLVMSSMTFLFFYTAAASNIYPRHACSKSICPPIPYSPTPIPPVSPAPPPRFSTADKTLNLYLRPLCNQHTGSFPQCAGGPQWLQHVCLITSVPRCLRCVTCSLLAERRLGPTPRSQIMVWYNDGCGRKCVFSLQRFGN